MNLVYLSNIQFLSLYGDKSERKQANKILNAYFKSLTLQRKVDAESYKTIIKQGLPMTNYNEVGSKEAKQLMKEVRRDIRNRTSTTHAVVHFVKGLNVAQQDIEKFLIGSVEALVFATFAVVFATITLLLVPVISLN